MYRLHLGVDMIPLLQVVDESMEPIANQTSQLKLEVIGESWRLYVHTMRPKSPLIQNPKNCVTKLLNKGGNFLLKKNIYERDPTECTLSICTYVLSYGCFN